MPAERTPHADDSLLAGPLLAVTEWSLRAPLAVLTGAVALALLSIVVAVNGLAFKTSRLDLLNPRSEYNRRWLAYLEEFGDRDDAVLVVRAEEPAELTAAIDDLAARLRAEPQWFDAVLHRRDLSALKRKAIHYLSPDELGHIERQLREAGQRHSPHFASDAQSQPDPAHAPLAIIATLNEQLTHVGLATPEQRQRVEAQYVQAAERLLAAINRPALPDPLDGHMPRNLAERRESDPPPPGDIQRLSYTPDASAPDLLSQFEPKYLLADDGRLGFVLFRFVKQRGEAAPNGRAIARVRELVRETQTSHPQAWIGLTGMPVIEHDEMRASRIDMVWTSLLSLVGVAVLFAAGYGGLRHAVLACGVLLLGMAYSFGFVTLAIGHLNILSAAFGVVLIGLGIDFGIHYVARYLKLRGEGCTGHTALMRTAVEVGPAVVTGGVTTSAAFFMAAMTDFVGVRELGLVAGGGLLLCVASAVIVLPPLILVVDRRWPLTRVPGILPAGRWFRFPPRWPRATMAAALAGAVAVSAGIANLRYDHNLLNLQPRHLESADVERQLLTHLDDSVWFAVSICNSRQELHERKARFESLPIVAKTEEIASLLPDHSAEHAERIQNVCRLLAAIPDAPPAPPHSIDPDRLRYEIARGQQLLSRETPYETSATLRLAALNGALTHLPPQEVERRMRHYSTSASTSAPPAAPHLPALREMADPLPPRLDDLPRELVERFVGASRSYVLRVYAKGDIWSMHELESFVRQIESVDPRVTGHPVQTYYASRHMQESYLWAGLYALAAVLVLLYIDFRSLWHSLLAMVPLAVGATMMCGLLGWLGLAFNPANMIVLPLILGIGVDDGVHLVHAWRQQKGRFRLGDATAVALLLTSTTTMASFGSLILARHQGLQSLGQVLTLGVLTCLAASLIFFPALIAALTTRRSKSVSAPPGEVGVGCISAAQCTSNELPHPQPQVGEVGVGCISAAQCTSNELEVFGGTYASIDPHFDPPKTPNPLPPPPSPTSAPPSAPVLPPAAPAPEPVAVAQIADDPPLDFIAWLPATAPEPAPPPPAPTAPPPQSPIPLPVTDEEVAALLDSAFTSRTFRCDAPCDDEPAASAPRRRTLLRRASP